MKILNVLKANDTENPENNVYLVVSKKFKSEYFSKKIERKLQSNNEDREHIPVVLLSNRKYALCLDNKFIADLKSFPGFTVTVEKRSEKLNYKD